MVFRNRSTGMVNIGAGRKTCAACGAPMRDRRRWTQDEVEYLWLECTREGCPARTLVKMDPAPHPAMGRLNPVTHAAMLM